MHCRSWTTSVATTSNILLDVFHSWCEPDLHDHLKEHVGRIVSVDLNDVRPEERSGFDREFPGRGRRTAPASSAP